MTPRERWQAVLSGEKADRVPTDYWATGEVTDRLLRELNCEDVDALARMLGIDLLHGAGPTYIGPKVSESEGKTIRSADATAAARASPRR